MSQAPDTGGPNRHTCWLATINRDGSPHVTGIGALWVDDAFWFETGEATRKGKNLARDPRCTLSVATHDFNLVVEGEARKVTDPSTVAAMAERWVAEGWPARVDDTGLALTAEFSAPSAGPPPWFVYRLSLQTATALLTVEPGGATRWRFSRLSTPGADRRGIGARDRAEGRCLVVHGTGGLNAFVAGGAATRCGCVRRSGSTAKRGEMG